MSPPPLMTLSAAASIEAGMRNLRFSPAGSFSRRLVITRFGQAISVEAGYHWASL